MTGIAIRVDNLSKLYPARSLAVWRPGVGWARHLGALHQRPDTTSTVLTQSRRRLRPGSASLRDALTGFLPRISRTLAPACALAAAARAQAGAGESTLLKILSRITEPTSGRAETCGGRVGSLLAVGDAAFHEEALIVIQCGRARVWRGVGWMRRTTCASSRRSTAWKDLSIG